MIVTPFHKVSTSIKNLTKESVSRFPYMNLEKSFKYSNEQSLPIS